MTEVSMGAKTAILAYASGSVADVLRNRPTEAGRTEAEAVLRRLHPAWPVSADAVSPLVGNLAEAVYPPEDTAYVSSFPGLEVLCDQRLVLDHPSRLPQRLLEAANGRAVVLHAMHSVVDWLAFAIWIDGVLVRSLSVSPDGGIQENIGEPLSFEAPFWAGDHPVEPIPDLPDQTPYPLPFHPLELGEEALRALFGFVLEGLRDPEDADAFDIPAHGFRLTDPDGPTPEQRKAEQEALKAHMGPPRFFQRQPDGSMLEVDLA
jgi:hypothetical protein